MIWNIVYLYHFLLLHLWLIGRYRYIHDEAKICWEYRPLRYISRALTTSVWSHSFMNSVEKCCLMGYEIWAVIGEAAAGTVKMQVIPKLLITLVGQMNTADVVLNVQCEQNKRDNGYFTDSHAGVCVFFLFCFFAYAGNDDPYSTCRLSN